MVRALIASLRQSLFGRLLLLFLALTGAFALSSQLLKLEFGQSNYWDHHGIFFLFFVALFPRLTLLFSSVPFGGFLWWLGFFFAPRLLVAVLATLAYWHANPILVMIAWLVALGGESSEKTWVIRRSSQVRHGFNEAKWVTSEIGD